MCADECTVLISGLLMSLNVIDYSISLNGEEFDKPVSVCLCQCMHEYLIRPEFLT